MHDVICTRSPHSAGNVQRDNTYHANAFHRILDQFKTQEMCIKAVEVDPSFLQLVPDHFKAKEMCSKAIKEDSSSLQFVPDWFVIRK